MNSSCASDCLDSESPLEKKYTRMRQWEEGDKEFLRLLTTNKEIAEITASPSVFTPVHAAATPPAGGCDHSYACRQAYLRSYPFTKKQTAAQKIKKCLKEKKKKCLKPSTLKNMLGVGGPFSFIDSVFKSVFSCATKRREVAPPLGLDPQQFAHPPFRLGLEPVPVFKD
ncbi:hypothetical protein U1Q18_033723 [Sarracenia purpurea var. burkii]